ncbi:MAG: hypothetical protein ACR2PQ_04705, partial [Myxococcota bacterium]
GCIFGYQTAGLPGLILGVAAGALAGYATIAAALHSVGLPTGRQDVTWTVAALGLGALVGVGPHALAPALGLDRVDLVTLGVGAAVVGPLALSFAGRFRQLVSGSGSS